MAAPFNTQPPTYPIYDVFISHAGEDKATIAIPLREKLKKHHIIAFVDEADMPAGTEAAKAMEAAMETSKAAVIVLSPQFVARKWPIKELLCFLRRYEKGSTGHPDVPVIIPFFYRLTIEDLYQEPRLDRRDKDGIRLYVKSRFFERMKNNEPEADLEAIEAALRKLHAFMGVRNDFEASNDSAHIMYRRREVLLQELCDKIQESLKAKEPLPRTEDVKKVSRRDDTFCAYFDTMHDISDLVFDFDYQVDSTKACSQEAQLLEIVLDQSQSETACIAIRGIGGVGKTSLVRGLSCLDRVKQSFKDGVYHLSLGLDSSKRGCTEELRNAVRGSGGHEKAEALSKETKIEHVIAGFRSWFQKKTCLFIVDDVWQTREIPVSVIHELLRLHISGEKSKILMTTRSSDIASLAGTRFDLEPRRAVNIESRRILMRYACLKPEKDEDRNAVNEILKICSGLPLFLAVAGKAVNAIAKRRGHEGCIAYHTYARTLRGNLHPMLTTDISLHARLDASLTISLRLLEEKKNDFGFPVHLSIIEMHRRLSVMRKLSKVPMTMLKFLWELEDESQAAFIAGEFERIGLAYLEFEKRHSGHVELLHLHDSLLEFAVMEARKHGVEKSGHCVLVSGYGRGLAMRDGCREWWHSSLEGDGYVHENICRHLLAAGQAAELIHLLMSPQWTERQVKINGILVLQSDFSIGCKATEDGMTLENSEERSEMATALGLISEAVTLSSGFVASNIAELPFQLLGRLNGFRHSYRAIQKYVSWMEADIARPLILPMGRFLGEPGGVITRIVFIGSPVSCMVTLNDGERVVCGCMDGRVFVVNMKRSRVERKWKAHNDHVLQIAVVRDGTRFVSGSRDATAKVWEVKTGRLVTLFDNHTETVCGVAVMGDGRRVVSVSVDGTAKVWDMETGQCLSKPFTAHNAAIRCVAVLGAREDVVVTAGDDFKLRLWNVTTSAQIGDSFDGHCNDITCVACTPDGLRILSASRDATTRVWDVGSHQEMETPDIRWKKRFDVNICMALSGDGHRLVTAASMGYSIRVWDLETRTQICNLWRVHAGEISAISFLAGVDRIVSSSRDGTVHLWDMTRKQTERFTSGHDREVSSVSFTPDGRFVVSGSFDNTLRIWETASGKQVGKPLEGHSDVVNDVVVTPDGRNALSVSDDKTVRLWDLKSRKLVDTTILNIYSMWSFAISPQGDRVAMASGDKLIRVWDVKSMHKGPIIVGGHIADLMRVFFTDDGLRIVSVDWAHNVFVWELETKTVVKRMSHEHAYKLSRREVLNIVGEATVRDDTTLSIPLYGREIFYGQGPDVTILATMEADVYSWALSPDKKTICVGLKDGQVVFLKLLV